MSLVIPEFGIGVSISLSQEAGLESMHGQETNVSMLTISSIKLTQVFPISTLRLF